MKTDYQIFTKALPQERFEYLRQRLGMASIRDEHEYQEVKEVNKVTDITSTYGKTTW